MACRRWREHRGADCPIDPKAEVVIRFRNGRENGPSPTSHWRWKAWPDGDSDFDIVAWRPADATSD